MPVYTVSSSAQPLLRDQEEGQLIEVVVDVLRDGTSIGGFDQRYGVDVSNQELADDLRARIRQIVTRDYEALTMADLRARCDQIAASLNEWTRKLP